MPNAYDYKLFECYSIREVWYLFRNYLKLKLAIRTASNRNVLPLPHGPPPGYQMSKIWNIILIFFQFPCFPSFFLNFVWTFILISPPYPLFYLLFSKFWMANFFSVCGGGKMPHPIPSPGIRLC